MPQPPIDRNARAEEARRSVPGLVAVLLGAGMLLAGLWLPTQARTKTGEPATERQLVRAFRAGGVVKAEPQQPPQPEDQAVDVAVSDDQEPTEEAPDTRGRTPNLIIDQDADEACPT